MDADLTVSLETKPKLTTEELARIMRNCGDEHFHDNIVDWDAAGELPHEVAPAHIAIELDTRKGGRLEGMEIETPQYLRVELIERGIEPVKVDVTPVPENPLP